MQTIRHSHEESKLEKSSVKGQQYMIVYDSKSTYFILFHHITQCTLYTFIYIYPCIPLFLYTTATRQHYFARQGVAFWTSRANAILHTSEESEMIRGDVENHTRVNIAVYVNLYQYIIYQCNKILYIYARIVRLCYWPKFFHAISNPLCPSAWQQM